MYLRVHMAGLHSLTAKMVKVGTKNSNPVAFLRRNQYKKDKKHNHNNNHNHPHHGKLLPPPAMWILYLQPIQCKRNMDKRLGKGVVEAI